jgi:hypothetical protein
MLRDDAHGASGVRLGPGGARRAEESSPAGPYRSFTHVALPTDQPPFKITIGSVPFVSGEGKVATAINAPDTASGVIPAEAVSTSPVDWSAPARVTIGESLLTTGHVVEAAPTNEGAIRWDVQSALMLSENRMPPMLCQNLSSLEVAYAAAREAGFQRDQMHIQGLDAVASEAMWVLARSEALRLTSQHALAPSSSSMDPRAFRC